VLHDVEEAPLSVQAQVRSRTPAASSFAASCDSRANRVCNRHAQPGRSCSCSRPAARCAEAWGLAQAPV